MNENESAEERAQDPMEAVQNALVDIQNMAIKQAAEEIRVQGQKNKLMSAKVYCLSLVVSVLLVCLAAIACFAIYQQQETIREQQYALNAQYAQLMEYVSGAEITTVTESYEASADDGSTAVLGDNNTTTIGGRLNGGNRKI